MRPKPLALPRLRPGLALRHRPRLRWALVLVAALVTGTSVTAAIERAERAEAAWGTTRTVVLVTRDLAPGDAVDASSTDVVSRPAKLVPAGALSALPEGARAGSSVLAGELLLEGRLAPGAASALAARLPPGTRAVTVPADPGTTPTLVLGDRVDVLVALAPESAGTGPPGFAVVTAAPVIDVTDVAITIAVPAEDAPRVAVALSQGAVTLALVGAT